MYERFGEIWFRKSQFLHLSGWREGSVMPKISSKMSTTTDGSRVLFLTLSDCFFSWLTQFMQRKLCSCSASACPVTLVALKFYCSTSKVRNGVRVIVILGHSVNLRRVHKWRPNIDELPRWWTWSIRRVAFCTSLETKNIGYFAVDLNLRWSQRRRITAWVILSELMIKGKIGTPLLFLALFRGEIMSQSDSEGNGCYKWELLQLRSWKKNIYFSISLSESQVLL